MERNVWWIRVRLRQRKLRDIPAVLVTQLGLVRDKDFICESRVITGEWRSDDLWSRSLNTIQRGRIIISDCESFIGIHGSDAK